MFVKTLLFSLVVLVTIQLCHCTGAFVHYDISFRESSNVTLTFSIRKNAYENNDSIKSLKVSVKNKSSGNTVFCQVLHINGTAINLPRCGYNSKKRAYSVTRQLQNPDGEVWEVIATLESKKQLQQLVKVQIPAQKRHNTSNPEEEQKEGSILTTQTLITIGVGGGVFLLVVVVSVVLCQKKVGRCCGPAQLTNDPRIAQTDGCRRALSAVHSHMYFVAAEHSQETQCQDFETFHDSNTLVKQENHDTRSCNQSDEFSSGGNTDEDIYVNQESLRA